MDDVELDFDGIPRGRNCAACGAPLEPGLVDDTTELVWLCPNHGVVDRTADPFA